MDEIVICRIEGNKPDLMTHCDTVHSKLKRQKTRLSHEIRRHKRTKLTKQQLLKTCISNYENNKE